MQYILSHSALGFCPLDIAALALLAAVAALYFVKIRAKKKEIEELTKQIPDSRENTEA